jgi:hypothetical protein
MVWLNGDKPLTKDLTLYDTLKNSYADKKTQKKQMKQYGYYRDKQLSNENQQVYYKPDERKVLLSVTGTHNLADWGTDAYGVAAGNLKDTNRYKEADSALNKAKAKYGVDKATIAGHSLGGSISQYIASPKDQVYTLDKGATIGQGTRSNENAYRSAGDAVSALNAGSTRMKTIPNQQGFLGQHKYALLGSLAGPYGTLAGAAYDAYTAHDVDNIKNEKIYI